MSSGVNLIITPLIVLFILLASIPAQQRQKVMRKTKSKDFHYRYRLRDRS